MTFRSKKLLESARGQSCIRCGADDGTVVAAHYTGYRRLELGGGFGIKVADCAHAALCMRCHQFMDQTGRDKSRQIEHSEEFLLLCVKTAMRLYDQGILK